MSSSEVAPTSAEMTRTTPEAKKPVQQQDITLDVKPEVRDRVVFWSLYV